MTVRTTNLWLASWWYAVGLHLVEASGVEDPRRVVFLFDDPDERERRLTSEFCAHETLLRTLRARSDLGHALYLAKSTPARRCSGDELERKLETSRRHGGPDDPGRLRFFRACAARAGQTPPARAASEACHSGGA